jgi:hypothetical protein
VMRPRTGRDEATHGPSRQPYCGGGHVRPVMSRCAWAMSQIHGWSAPPYARGLQSFTLSHDLRLN